MSTLNVAEKIAKEFEDCVIQRMTEMPQLTREQAEALCLPASYPESEPTPSGGKIDQGHASTSSIHGYWRRADRRARIRRQIDTSHSEELPVHERCVRALMEIEGLNREKAELQCTVIEKKREIIANESLGNTGDLGEDDIEAGCIASVMSTQHITMEKARAVCDRILHPESFIEYKGLMVLPSIIDEDMFVKAVERRMDLLETETVKQASLELLTLFSTDAKFGFAWKNQCRRERAMDVCVQIRRKKRKETKSVATATCEKAMLFVQFLDDSFTNKLHGDVWDYIGEQIIIRSRLFSVSENTAKDWVHKELQRKGLLSSRTPLPTASPVPIGNLFRKTDAQIRRMDRGKQKTGLDSLYLEPAYGMNESENEEFDLESCIEGHVERGLSHAEAKTKCEEERDQGRALPGSDPNE